MSVNNKHYHSLKLVMKNCGGILNEVVKEKSQQNG